MALTHYRGYESGRFHSGPDPVAIAVRLVPASVIIPLVENGLGLLETFGIEHFTDNTHILDDTRRFAMIHMMRKEVQGGSRLIYIIEEFRAVSPWIGESRSADLQVGEALLQMLRRHGIQFVKLRHSTSPGTRVRLPAVIRLVKVRLVPDFPVLYPHPVAIRPAFVIMPDYVLADFRPLLEVLGRIDAIFLCLVLDTLSEPVERFRPGLKHIQKDYIGIGKIVGFRRIHIGFPVGKDLIYIYAVPAVLRPEGSIVGPGIRYPERLIGCHYGISRTVIACIHRFDRPHDGGRIESDHRLGGH